MGVTRGTVFVKWSAMRGVPEWSPVRTTQKKSLGCFPKALGILGVLPYLGYIDMWGLKVSGSSPSPKTTTTATWYLPIPRNRSRWCLNHFPRISEDSLPESRTGVNLSPRVSHLPALLEQGGGRMIDPGNEVVRVFQKNFRNYFPNVWRISRAWNRLVSSLRCVRLSPVVRETISLRRRNLVIYCKLCNKCLL